MFRLPAVPMVLGFDPRLQFVHEDDVVHALEHAAFHVAPGIYNVAADGVLALSEVIDLVGQGRRADPAAVGDRHRHRLAAAARLPDPGTRSSTSSGSGEESTTASSRRPGSTTATPAARP